MAGVLNDRQRLFVLEYLVDRNATQAAIRAGYSEKTAKQIGSRLLTNVDVAAEIQKLGAKKAAKLEITQERVLQELAAIGFARVTDYLAVRTEPEEKLGIHPITGEVTMLPAGWFQYVKIIDTADLPEDKLAAVAGIKQGRNGIELKLHDKPRALEMLGKHLGLFDNGAAAVPQENNLFNAIVGSAGEDVNTDDIPELEQEATAGDDMVAEAEV